MDSVGIRDLGRNASEVVERVERTGEPVIVTRRGRPAAVMVPISAEDLDDYILANAREFVEGMAAADRELAAGETRPLAAVLADLDG